MTNMMMTIFRRIRIAAIALLMTLGLIGCGNTASGNKPKDESLASSSAASTDNNTDEEGNAGDDLPPEAPFDEDEFAEGEFEYDGGEEEFAALERIISSHYMVRSYDEITPVTKELAVVRGTTMDDYYFTGFITGEGELVQMPGYTNMLPVSENRFFAPKAKPASQTHYNLSQTLYPMKGKLIDEKGNIIFDDPMYRFLPTKDNRLLAITVESDISEKTVKCGIMDGNGNWIRKPGTVPEFEDFLNSDMVYMEEDGTWNFTDLFYSCMAIHNDGEVIHMWSNGYLGNGSVVGCNYLYDSRDDSFHKGFDTQDHTVKAYKEKLYASTDLRNSYILDPDFNIIRELPDYLPVSAAGMENGKDIPTDYFINRNAGTIHEYSTNRDIAIDSSIVPYLTDYATYVSDGFLCFLVGNDQQSYYAKIDMDGHILQEPVKLPGQSFRHRIVLDDCMVVYSPLIGSVYIVDISSGEELSRLEYGNIYDEFRDLIYINDNYFLVFGHKRDDSYGYIIMDFNGQILSEA